MPTATCSDFPPKSLQTKQKEGRFFSKPKFLEDYHGGESASHASVPFTWESRPGTPKVKYLENEEVTPTLPPLTPPPSYYSSSPATKRPATGRNLRSSSTFCSAIFPKRNNVSKPRLPSLSPASSSRSSSSFASSLPISQSYSVPSSPVTTAASKPRQRKRMPNPRLSFDPRMDNEEQDQDELSAVSAFCFSLRVSDRSRVGCYASVIKVLLRDCK